MESYGNAHDASFGNGNNTALLTESINPQITKTVNGCTVVLRFAVNVNDQVSSVVKGILMQSYKDKLFQK